MIGMNPIAFSDEAMALIYLFMELIITKELLMLQFHVLSFVCTYMQGH
jgi:hypothetical protein